MNTAPFPLLLSSVLSSLSVSVNRNPQIWNRGLYGPQFEVKPETVTLDNEEILRYSRHLIMPEVGMEGQ